MESEKIYEDARTELLRINKCLNSDHIDINMNELDTVTRGEIKYAINEVISKRTKDIESIIFKVM